MDIGAETEDAWTSALLAVLAVIEVLLQHATHVASQPAPPLAALKDKSRDAEEAVHECIAWAKRAGSAGMAPLLRISKVRTPCLHHKVLCTNRTHGSLRGRPHVHGEVY